MAEPHSGRLSRPIDLDDLLDALQHAETEAACRAEEQRALFHFTDCLFRAESLEDAYAAALDAIIAALRCDRASVLIFDPDDVMQFVASHDLSDSYRAAAAGHTPWRRGQRRADPITIEDAAVSDLAPELRTVIANEGISALGFVPIFGNDGVTGKFMCYFNAPHAFTRGELDLAQTIARQLGFGIERLRIAAERESVERSRQLLTSIVENSDDAIISKNLDGFIVSWNAGAERLFGYKPEEIIGRHVTTLMPPARVDEEPGIIERIRRGERIEHYETVRRRKDGVDIDISLTVSPVKDASGRIVGASKIARDITERKRAEAQRTLLINELNHRVKNTLATVQSLAMQTLRNTERSEDARESFDARLAALSRAHDLLTTENWEGADLDEVIERAIAPFRSRVRVRATGPSVRLATNQALALSIALHELATNAAKYGALSVEGGHVAISWRIDAGTVRLEWRESGGPPVTKPTRLGFGTRLIQRGLAHDLGGDAEICFHADGVAAYISTPLESLRRT